MLQLLNFRTHAGIELSGVAAPAQVMVGAYGAAGEARGALLPAPAPPPGKGVIARALPQRNGGDAPAVTVFIGNISARAPDAMVRALLAACGAVLSWKRVSTFGFCEFGGVEAALRCVRLLHDRQVADRRLVARTDGKMQALVDSYKSLSRSPILAFAVPTELATEETCGVSGEQRSRLSGEEAAAAGGADEAAGEEGYLDSKQRGLDDAAERRLVQIMRDYQHEINNYETLQKGESAPGLYLAPVGARLHST